MNPNSPATSPDSSFKIPPYSNSIMTLQTLESFISYPWPTPLKQIPRHPFRKGWVTLKTPYDLKDCIETHCASTVTLYMSTLFQPDSLTSPWYQFPPEYDPEFLSGFWIIRFFHHSAFVKTWHLPAYGIPPIQLRLIDGNIQFHHLTGPGPATLFPYRESQKLTLFVHSIGTRVAHCTRILLAHPLQSLNWLGIGQHLFLAIGATQILELTPIETFLSVAPHQNLQTLSRRLWNPLPW